MIMHRRYILLKKNSFAEQISNRETPINHSSNPDKYHAPQVCLFQCILKPTRRNISSNLSTTNHIIPNSIRASQDRFTQKN